MWTPDNWVREIPAPDPKRRWELNHNDRWFLRGLKIDPEDAKTPYPSKHAETDEGD